MGLFKDYEVQVLTLLASNALSHDQMRAVLNEGKLVSYNYTGCGYFLTLSHPSLPEQRIVCSKPIVTGSAEGVPCGFVIFIQDREITLECHDLGPTHVPEDFRNKLVHVSAT
jgi:hypothetical protein